MPKPVKLGLVLLCGMKDQQIVFAKLMDLGVENTKPVCVSLVAFSVGLIMQNFKIA